VTKEVGKIFGKNMETHIWVSTLLKQSKIGSTEGLKSRETLSELRF
jgi:hypothetical protein